MKILVGTLYSGENEYEECLTSIQAQTYKNYDNYVIKNLPKKEAHATLYSTFLERAGEYSAMIKVDADMVLVSHTLFEKIAQKLSQNDWLDVFSIAIYDFFSGQLINGLNTYRNNVRWSLRKDSLNADTFVTSPDRYFFDDKFLAPAATHCKNPSPFQAFHYGVHRGLKSLQSFHGVTHWNLLDQTWKKFRISKDVRIGLASLGAELAYAGHFDAGDLDYTNPRIKNVLDGYLSFDPVRMYREIKKIRLLNWGFLPGKMRRKVLRLLQSSS